jgi:hypothetical protein
VFSVLAVFEKPSARSIVSVVFWVSSAELVVIRTRSASNVSYTPFLLLSLLISQARTNSKHSTEEEDFCKISCQTGITLEYDTISVMFAVLVVMLYMCDHYVSSSEESGSASTRSGKSLPLLSSSLAAGLFVYALALVAAGLALLLALLLLPPAAALF